MNYKPYWDNLNTYLKAKYILGDIELKIKHNKIIHKIYRFSNYFNEGIRFLAKLWPDINGLLIPLMFIQNQFNIVIYKSNLIIGGIVFAVLVLISGIFYRNSGLLEAEQRASINHNPLSKEQYDRLIRIEKMLEKLTNQKL